MVVGIHINNSCRSTQKCNSITWWDILGELYDPFNIIDNVFLYNSSVVTLMHIDLYMMCLTADMTNCGNYPKYNLHCCLRYYVMEGVFTGIPPSHRIVYTFNMMTSSNENIFRVTGPLCGEFTGHRWIPLTKASDAELWCFLWSPPE